MVRSTVRGCLSSGLLVGLLVLPALASAQVSRDLDLQQLRLGAGTHDVLGVTSASLPQPGRWSLRLGAHWAQSPVRLVYATDRSTAAQLVDHQLMMDLGGAWTPLPWLELSAAVPLVLHQGAAPTLPALGASGLGDLRISPKVALFRGPRLSVAAAVPVTLPTGLDDAFAGRPDVTVRPEILGELRVGDDLRISASTGVVLRRTERWANLVQGPALGFGLAGSWRLPLGDRSLSALATLVGEMDLQADGVEETPLEALLGVTWLRPGGLSLTVAAGPGLTQGAGTPVWRGVALLGWSPAPSLRHAAPRAVPEPMGGAPRTRTRPQPPGVRIDSAGRRLELTEPVYFAEDQDRILEASHAVLRQVARTLLEHPEIRLVRVDGHTDDQGDDTYNLALSQRRVEGVVRFLVAEGVERDRLHPVGHGEKQPVADNGTEAGRAKNRRVEFTLVEVAR